MKVFRIKDYENVLKVIIYLSYYNKMVTTDGTKETKRDYIFKNFKLDEIDKMIINLIIDNPKITQRELSIKLGLTKTPIQKRQKHLIELGIIKRKGGRRYGYWEIIENNNNQKT
ncbi:MAG: winged helix-turn-helix transcriptional regulator [Erysipelotrichaceae bacterium]|nr:winged helix-turn-helix transcriptional regulator [Erysipelotrichaceae bacterium]